MVILQKSLTQSICSFLVVTDRLNAEKDASGAQLMWGACQALGRAVKAAPPGTSPEKSVRPLEPEIKAIVKAARK